MQNSDRKAAGSRTVRSIAPNRVIAGGPSRHSPNPSALRKKQNEPTSPVVSTNPAKNEPTTNPSEPIRIEIHNLLNSISHSVPGKLEHLL